MSGEADGLTRCGLLDLANRLAGLALAIERRLLKRAPTSSDHAP